MNEDNRGRGLPQGCQNVITLVGVAVVAITGLVCMLAFDDLSKEVLLAWALLASLCIFPAWLFGTWTSRFETRAFVKGVNAGREFAGDAMQTLGIGRDAGYEVVDYPYQEAPDPFGPPQPPPRLMIEGAPHREERVDL